MKKWVNIPDLEAVEEGGITSDKYTQPKRPSFFSLIFPHPFHQSEVIAVFSVTPSHHKEISILMCDNLIS